MWLNRPVLNAAWIMENFYGIFLCCKFDFFPRPENNESCERNKKKCEDLVQTGNRWCTFMKQKSPLAKFTWKHAFPFCKLHMPIFVAWKWFRIKVKYNSTLSRGQRVLRLITYFVLLNNLAFSVVIYLHLKPTNNHNETPRDRWPADLGANWSKSSTEFQERKNPKQILK